MLVGGTFLLSAGLPSVLLRSSSTKNESESIMLVRFGYNENDQAYLKLATLKQAGINP